MAKRAIGTICPWFGSARMVAPRIGEALRGRSWVGIPFAGGMPEVVHIGASTIVANDAHEQMMNLAEVARHPVLGPRLYRRLRRRVFTQEALKAAQSACREWDKASRITSPDIDAAENYFIACWMGRSGKSGIDDEFNGKISIRWNANGGDSNTRFRSAVKSLVEWRRVLQRVNLTCCDAFDFLDRCEDKSGNGIYCDPPWPDDGDRYKHSFTEKDHERLARKLATFKVARVVLRIGEHPLVQRLYPESEWAWTRYESRTQGNNAKPEILITNERRGLFS